MRSTDEHRTHNLGPASRYPSNGQHGNLRTYFSPLSAYSCGSHLSGLTWKEACKMLTWHHFVLEQDLAAPNSSREGLWNRIEFRLSRAEDPCLCVQEPLTHKPGEPDWRFYRKL